MIAGIVMIPTPVFIHSNVNRLSLDEAAIFNFVAVSTLIARSAMG